MGGDDTSSVADRWCGSFHIVIPAQAGIQTWLTDVRTLRLDSRFRGNDDVGHAGMTMRKEAGMTVGRAGRDVQSEPSPHALVLVASPSTTLRVVPLPRKRERSADCGLLVRGG
ncbi:MAG: hypothetical protein BGO82_04890 [Devosia sp. 67-54]|nr:MAG: hypothetical protein BGO82_04890 [Devosia sp. 67-54]